MDYLNPEPPPVAPLPATAANGHEEHALFHLGDDDDDDDDAKSALDRKMSSSYSSSSSHSSSEEDFFQLDATDFARVDPDIVSNGGSLKHPPNAGNDAHQLASDSNEQPADNIDLLLGARQSPPVQTMVRSDVPDPYRIPSSVFARTKSTAPVEWSVASNESLFSIHMGNSSFSRDHVILLGRSGELPDFPSSPPDTENEFEQPVSTEAANAEAMKVVLRAAADGHAAKGHRPPAENMPLSSSTSRRSDCSVASVSSFAFPILTGEIRGGSVRFHDLEQHHQQKGHKQPEAEKEVEEKTQGPVAAAATPNPNAAPARKCWCPRISCCFCWK